MEITALSATNKSAIAAPAAGPARDLSANQSMRDVQGAQGVASDARTAAATTTKPAEEAEKDDPAVLKKTVDELNAAMKQRASAIEFSIDEDSGKTVVKVMDLESKEVLKQYPSRELLAIAKQIDQFQGMFVKTKA